MRAKRQQLPYLEEVRTLRHVCFAEQLRSANRAITKLYTQHLGDSDIGIAQLSLLIRLYYFGEVGISKLAQQLETDRTTLARNVQLLENSGHVVIGGGEDRRARLVALTDKGYESLKRTIPRWLEAQKELHARLGRERWDELFAGLRLLAKLAAGSPQTEHDNQAGKKVRRKSSDGIELGGQ